MTPITHLAFAKLEAEGRLQSPTLKAPTHLAGRFGFRGELAVKFAPRIADEARPPEMIADQVLAAGNEAEGTLNFLACYLHSFAYAKPLAEVLSGLLSKEGTYFLFCNNLDLLAKYRMTLDGVLYYVLPIDEASVYNEVLELLYLEKNDLKKLDTAGKHDAIVEAALRFTADWPQITYEDGLKLMGPVRNANENRPV